MEAKLGCRENKKQSQCDLDNVCRDVMSAFCRDMQSSSCSISVRRITLRKRVGQFF